MKKIIMRNGLWRVILVSMSCACFYSLVVPLQTYLGNREMFAYGVWDLVPELLFFFTASIGAYKGASSRRVAQEGALVFYHN